MGDAELLAAWHSGDKGAGSQLFTRHFDALYRFFANKLPDDAEDLVQGTWMACVRYEDSLRKAASFRAYLFAIARNELYRALKGRSPSDEVDFSVSSMIDLGASPVSIAAAAERDRDLLGALRAIPIDAQIVLELHYWEDLSGTELAEVLGVPQGTAKSRIRRAKALLAAALSEETPVVAGDAMDQWVRSMRAKVALKSP